MKYSLLGFMNVNISIMERYKIIRRLCFIKRSKYVKRSE